MVGLSLHRSHPGIHNGQPIVDLIMLLRALREANLMILLIVLLDQILHDASQLEEPNRLTICESVRESGDAAIRIDCKEFRDLALILWDLGFLYGIWEAKFFEGDGYFDAVGRLSSVRMDFGSFARHGVSHVLGHLAGTVGHKKTVLHVAKGEG